MELELTFFNFFSYGVGDSFEHGDVLELEKKIEELGLMLQAERTNNIEVKAALCQAESTIRELQRDVEVQQSKQNKVCIFMESEFNIIWQNHPLFVIEKFSSNIELFFRNGVIRGLVHFDWLCIEVGLFFLTSDG